MEAFSLSVTSGDLSGSLFQVLAPHCDSLAAGLFGEEEGSSKLESLEERLGEGRPREDVCCDLFQAWLAGEGKKPVAWNTLVTVLQEMDLESVAKKVRKLKCEAKTRDKAASNRVAVLEQMFR